MAYRFLPYLPPKYISNYYTLMARFKKFKLNITYDNYYFTLDFSIFNRFKNF